MDVRFLALSPPDLFRILAGAVKLAARGKFDETIKIGPFRDRLLIDHGVWISGSDTEVPKFVNSLEENLKKTDVLYTWSVEHTAGTHRSQLEALDEGSLLDLLLEGGAGSGNFGHKGRKGSWGGSAGGGGASAVGTAMTGDPGMPFSVGSAEVESSDTGTGGSWKAAGSEAVLQRWEHSIFDELDEDTLTSLSKLPEAHLRKSHCGQFFTNLDGDAWSTNPVAKDFPRAVGLYNTQMYGGSRGAIWRNQGEGGQRPKGEVDGTIYTRRPPPGRSPKYHEAVLFHEFGHSLELAAHKKYGSWLDVWTTEAKPGAISTYAKTNASEAFAEAYAFYALSTRSRARLAARAPKAHAYMEKFFADKS